MKTGFVDKLFNRMDRIDAGSLQTHFLRIVRERGLLETIFQSIQEGILVVDGKGRIRFANKATERMLGFSADEAEGKPVSRYLRGFDWDNVLKMEASEWSRLISREIEVKYPEHLFLECYIVPLASEKTAEDGAVVFFRDITKARIKEASLLESEKINAIKVLAAGVAHEIGNPLNSINIHLQLLDRQIDRQLSGRDSDELKQLVKVARSEVSRLDMIVVQFLKALRPLKPKFAMGKVESLVDDTLSLLKHEMEDRKIKVVIEYPEPIPRIRIDRDQLKQAFFNIIKNAMDAMNDGGTLTVSLSCTDKHVEIHFADTGTGIKAGTMGKVFEPYYTTKSGGSGLGMMIVQRIVQDHGGRIELRSKEGEGTVFSIFLPLAEKRIRLLKP